MGDANADHGESLIPSAYTEAIVAQITRSLPHFLTAFAPPVPLAVEELEAKRAAKAMREAEEASFLGAIDTVDAPLARKVLDLHAREGVHYLSCQGCDPGAYAEGNAEWPCATVTLVADEFGIRTPRHWAAL